MLRNFIFAALCLTFFAASALKADSERAWVVSQKKTSTTVLSGYLQERLIDTLKNPEGGLYVIVKDSEGALFPWVLFPAPFSAAKKGYEYKDEYCSMSVNSKNGKYKFESRFPLEPYRFFFSDGVTTAAVEETSIKISGTSQDLPDVIKAGNDIGIFIHGPDKGSLFNTLIQFEQKGKNLKASYKEYGGLMKINAVIDKRGYLKLTVKNNPLYELMALIDSKSE